MQYGEHRTPDLGIPVDDNSAALLARFGAMYPSFETPRVSYNDLITLAVSSAPRTEWDFWDIVIDRTGYMPQDNYYIDSMVGGVFAYYKDNVLPTLFYRPATEQERAMLLDLNATLQAVLDKNPEDFIGVLTYDVYDCGKRHYAQNELRNFFKAVYEICLGRSEGPRLPNFIALYGVTRWMALVNERLEAQS